MAKSKLYGGRWRTTDKLGEGGQSVVYRAIDESGEFQGEYALKRVLSTLRSDRFASEVQACLDLQHDNILPIIDHSQLHEPDAKKYLVSPIAVGKDLSKRVGLYAGVLDSTLVVAHGLCRALEYAHSHSVIHRDVKPENVLFRSGSSHEPWLADFGICLFCDDVPRATEAGERVGPPYFIAPELEAGGRLDVTPGADVYSLGKVIYYMISGGEVMARESLYDSNTSGWDSKGPRYQLLKNLLGKMICSLPNRLSSMSQVSVELERISTWEERVAGSPLSATSRTMIASLKESRIKAEGVRERNQIAREREIAHVNVIAAQFCSWLEQELSRVRAELEDPDVLCVAIRDLTRPPGSVIVTLNDYKYPIVAGREVGFTVPNVPFQTEHLLKFALCSSVSLSTHADGRHEIPERDVLLIAYPFYLAVPIGTAKQTGQQKLVKAGFAEGSGRHREICEVRFKASQWPAPIDQLQALLAKVLDSTIAKVSEHTSFR